MPTPITLKFDSVDVFQILDALNDRAEAWEKTEAMLNGEFDSDDFFVPEECHNPLEAKEAAQHFRDIAASIEEQLNSSN